MRAAFFVYRRGGVGRGHFGGERGVKREGVERAERVSRADAAMRRGRTAPFDAVSRGMDSTGRITAMGRKISRPM